MLIFLMFIFTKKWYCKTVTKNLSIDMQMIKSDGLPLFEKMLFSVIVKQYNKNKDHL